MNMTIATIITAALLAKTKAAYGVDKIVAKLNRPNFPQRTNAVAHALFVHGVSLEAIGQLKAWGWFSEDAPEQLLDWLTEIVEDLKANGAAGIPSECFQSLNDLGAVPAGDADECDIPSAGDLESDFNSPPADKGE